MTSLRYWVYSVPPDANADTRNYGRARLADVVTSRRRPIYGPEIRIFRTGQKRRPTKMIEFSFDRFSFSSVFSATTRDVGNSGEKSYFFRCFSQRVTRRRGNLFVHMTAVITCGHRSVRCTGAFTRPPTRFRAFGHNTRALCNKTS